MTSPRPASGPTLRIDLDRPVSFRFLNRTLSGYHGDSVASAMFAQGIRVFSRSLKYHRPRGLYGLDGESATTYMRIDGVPNECAETMLLREGMQVLAQNVKGNPRRDAYGFFNRLERWMPAGFYYRRFHKPYKLWPFFQNRIRRLAGLGELDLHRDWDTSGCGELYLHAEVAVIGGGPAGLAAALATADTGCRVVLFEKRPWLGGHFDWRVREAGGMPIYTRAHRLEQEVRAHANIRVLVHAPVTGVWGDNLVTGFQIGRDEDVFDERYIECRATSVVVATGCMERPLVFAHNDRPGVMQAGCAWRLARTYGILPGRRAVFSVADDLGLEAAADLASLGLTIPAVADARPDGHDPELVESLRSAGVEFLPHWAARATRGRKRVKGVILGDLRGGAFRRIPCDLLVSHAGRSAVLGPLATAKARFKLDLHTGMFQPTDLPLRNLAAGGLLGYTDPDSLEASGTLAGLQAVAASGRDAEQAIALAREKLDELPGPSRGCTLLHGPGLGKGNKAFICLDEDGTAKIARQCVQQGFDRPELAKRFGGFGLGPGQHQIPGQNLAMLMSELTGTPLEQCEGTTVRPPLVPALMTTCAGPNHHIFKRTPLHDDQIARGGIFRQAGAWKRARYFRPDLDCTDEILNVRNNAGMIDVSTLGKFRLHGPDALQALQRVYVSDMTRARPGRCVYSAMVNDTGNLIDDGVVVRLGESDYTFTTSSNRAGITVEWFRYHTRFDGWDYHLVNLTDALGTINLAGPRARQVLAKLIGDAAGDRELPHMGYRKFELPGGIPVACFRLGFVGELSYELHVPASATQAVWDLLWEAGQEFDIQPFGLEAQYCLRAEKGHIIIGAESEQRVTLLDLGLGFLWDQNDTASGKVGAPALRACANQRGRLKLVGFRVDDSDRHPQDGCLVHDRDEIVGWVCTTRHSPSLGWQYGMALVRDDLATEGSTLHLYENLGHGEMRTTATVIPRCFYDPRGKRMTL